MFQNYHVIIIFNENFEAISHLMYSLISWGTSYALGFISFSPCLAFFPRLVEGVGAETVGGALKYKFNVIEWENIVGGA